MTATAHRPLQWRGRLLTALAAIAVACLPSVTPRAQELPTEPILRIEAGQHVARINRADADASGRFAVTASSDKTVRVWSLPDGRLLRVLRLPIDFDNVGKASAVAMSPDGDTVAVGGWTGPRGHHNIFLIDRATGRLKQRLSDLPNVILHLVYSPDGRRLAASLAGKDGIRVFDAANAYRQFPSDRHYEDDSRWASFDLGARLVTASYDGRVRLYATDHYDVPLASRIILANRWPYSASMSLDGAQVAVGFAGGNDVVVLSGADLRQLYAADVTGIPDVDLLAVGWSHDGHFLFAGGAWKAGGVRQIRRWADGGHGTFSDIPAAPQTILQISPLSDGRMLFVSTDNFGLIGADGSASRLQGLGGLNLASGSGKTLRVSADGDVVQVESWRPLHTYRFSLSRREVELAPAADASLLAPVTQAPGLTVTNWQDQLSPAVNSVPLKLYDHEVARSLAVLPDGQRFVLGAEWSLRLYDKQGHSAWPARPIQGEAWHVNVAADGRLIVAAFADGTVRWLRMSDGKEVLALFMHPDGQRWIVWTPEGYYDASLGADDLIGWHINHGYDKAPDFYPASQFRSRFYRPDVIQRVLHAPNFDIAEALRQADATAGRSMAKAIPVSALLTPVVTIEDPKDQTAEQQTDLQLTYSVRLPSPDDTLRVEAQIDGVKVVTNDRRLVDSGAMRAGILRLTLPRRDAKISLIAYNAQGASEPASIDVLWRGPGKEPKLTLYVLAIGISEYRDEHVRLHFAAKDADDFAVLARAQGGGLYEKVIMHPPHGSLRDSEATREAVLDELDWIMRAVTNTNDVAMVFLSGHGMTTPDGRYRFLPYDYDPNRVERTTISDSELQDYLSKIGGKKIFFFDTCYSADVLRGKAAAGTRPDIDKFANELKAAENGVIVFASSTGNQLSQEKDEWRNGAFTKAVVEGLRGQAARPGANVISTADLESYVSSRVKELTNGNQRPMTAKPKTVEDYWIARVLN